MLRPGEPSGLDSTACRTTDAKSSAFQGSQTAASRSLRLPRLAGPAVYFIPVDTNQHVVYFDVRDYASPVRRMISFIIDQLFILVVLYAMVAAASWPPPDVRARMDAAPDRAARQQISKEYYAQPAVQKRQGSTLRFWFVLALAYHVAVRRTHGGTVGYRLAGIRLIDCHNEPPPWGALFRRFFYATALTIPFGLSYFLCLKHPKRQALHDKLCNTWVVRRGALPAGPGVVSDRMQLIGSRGIHYIDVEPMTSDVASEA